MSFYHLYELSLSSYLCHQLLEVLIITRFLIRSVEFGEKLLDSESSIFKVSDSFYPKMCQTPNEWSGWKAFQLRLLDFKRSDSDSDSFYSKICLTDSSALFYNPCSQMVVKNYFWTRWLISNHVNSFCRIWVIAQYQNPFKLKFITHLLIFLINYLYL